MSKFISEGRVHTGTVVATLINSGDTVLFGIFAPSPLVGTLTITGFLTGGGTPINIVLPSNTQGYVDIGGSSGIRVPNDLILTLSNAADLVLVEYEV